jgi:hypothetical protein
MSSLISRSDVVANPIRMLEDGTLLEILPDGSSREILAIYDPPQPYQSQTGGTSSDRPESRKTN